MRVRPRTRGRLSLPQLQVPSPHIQYTTTLSKRKHKGSRVIKAIVRSQWNMPKASERQAPGLFAMQPLTPSAFGVFVEGASTYLDQLLVLVPFWAMGQNELCPIVWYGVHWSGSYSPPPLPSLHGYCFPKESLFLRGKTNRPKQSARTQRSQPSIIANHFRNPTQPTRQHQDPTQVKDLRHSARRVSYGAQEIAEVLIELRNARHQVPRVLKIRIWPPSRGASTLYGGVCVCAHESFVFKVSILGWFQGNQTKQTTRF